LPSNWLKEKQRKYLLSGFYIFCRDSGALRDYDDQPHREMCDELESLIPGKSRRQQKKLYLAPRGSYKTSILKAFMVYCYLLNPNIRIVYGRANQVDAMQVLLSVKKFLKEPLIVDLWGDLELTALIWAEGSVTLARSNSTLTDPTFDTTGLGKSLTGHHPDIIILDDLVTDVNYRSDLTIERSRTLLFSALPVLEPTGSIIVSGTRWAANDVYGWIIAQDNELQEIEDAEAALKERPAQNVREWDLYIRSVYLADGSLFFPRVLHEDFLLQQKHSLRQRMMLFSSWYYNSPFEIGTKLFPSIYMEFVDGNFFRAPMPHIEFPTGEVVPLYVTMTIDPAPTVGKRSDFTGITVVGCDWRGHIYILAAEAMKKVPSEGAKHVLQLVRAYAPSVIGIETGQADADFVARLQRGLSELDIRCSIQSYSAVQDEKRGERGKDQRIESLEPFFREGVISFLRGPSFRDLLAQLDGYPSLDHDDVLDALAMQRKFMRSCRERTQADQLDTLEFAEELDSWGADGPPAPGVRKSSGSHVGRSSYLLR
jgi:predicted phage terminase large subunit-like protein